MMNKLLDLNRDEFVCIFLGATLLGNRNVANDIIRTPENLDKYELSELHKYISRKDTVYFLKHIEEIRLEMIGLLKEFYNSYFKEHWEASSTFYRSALINEKKSFDKQLPLNFILSLHQDLSFENDTIVMKKETQFMVKTEEISEIRILFSMFTFPHLMINIYEGIISIYENLIIPNMSTLFDDVAVAVKALGDSTRLAIIKVLLKNDLTNKSLARLINITPASVSQHLKVLKDSDLLISNRQKNNIFYGINKEKLNMLMNKLNHFLELDDKK
jgi:DNA-binding transcriptional ArsR family regulator